MRTDAQRIADTFQPMQPWVIRQLLGPTMGKLWALSMCSPTPEMVQVALESFGDLDPCFIRALKSSSFRRRCRKERKREMLPDLKAEAKEHKWKLLRSFLNELENSLGSRGYRLNDRRIPKIGELEAEYVARTEEFIKELNLQPRVLSQILSPAKTLGGIRSRNALPLLGGRDNYYAHLISLIYEIRHRPDEMEMSRGHVNYMIKGLIERLPPEMRRLVNELKSLQVDEGEAWLSGLLKDGARRKKLVDELLEIVDTEDKILPILRIIMRYLFIETIPSISSDETSSSKRLPLDDQLVEHIADGQVSIGVRRSTLGGMKPVYKIPIQEEPLEDSERLEKFVKLIGINLDDFNPKEQHRLIELMTALDMDYEFASKKGVSITDYYGGRADSEKTQRSRLFKKIKRLVDDSQLTE